jgi:3-deoxy-manno-octulosonate cytidylyltransferase (CMP-KDO synthetase)
MILGVIPARYQSTRLPGKPLVDILGLSMIERVYRQALKAKKLDRVVIATDHMDIFNHALDKGMEVVMTGTHHPSGTDRVFEAGTTFSDVDLLVNIQGDEPFIEPEKIDALVDLMLEKPNASIGTLCCEISDLDMLFAKDEVKVVMDVENKALYFSRAPIPFPRQKLENEVIGYYHIGLYAYRWETLRKIVDLPPSRMEQLESLEQLRWLENGYPIHIALTGPSAISVDTAEDLEIARKFALNFNS